MNFFTFNSISEVFGFSCLVFSFVFASFLVFAFPLSSYSGTEKDVAADQIMF